MNYILITPAKNEEKYLPNLINAIIKQTIKPLLWLIVDDGSTDKTPKIIEEAKRNHDWIKSIRLKEGPWDLGIHISDVSIAGFKFLIECCNNHDISYEFIGLIDADMVPERKYFESLIQKFEKNEKLGIASGSVYYKKDDSLILDKAREDLPRGGARLWRKECFFETKGYLRTYSPESVSNVKAKLRGWETRQFKEIKTIHSRTSSSANGFWHGYKIIGESHYFLNKNPLLVIPKTLKYFLKRPYYIGFTFLFGYLSFAINNRQKIDDEEIRNYFRKERPKEIIAYYWNKFKKLFGKA